MWQLEQGLINTIYRGANIKRADQSARARSWYGDGHQPLLWFTDGATTQ